MNRKKKTFIISAAGILILLLAAGLPRRAFESPGRAGDAGHGEHAYAAHTDEDEILYWTCAMCPELRLPEPGRSPICGMALVPVYKDEVEDPDIPFIALSEARVRLAGIWTDRVEKRDVSEKISLLGTVSFDETGLKDVAAWFPGRVEKLYVDFTGARVTKGEPLADLYSPELLSAQEEHLSVLRLDRESSRENVRASRRRLELLGMTPGRVEELERRGYAGDVLTFHAPASGTVLERNAFEGDYVNTGDRLFRIADLSRVWVMAEAYERDFAFAEPGRRVEFTAGAYPGERFAGEVVFIDPEVHPVKRTARLSMEIENPWGRLRPGMFGSAVLSGSGGESVVIPRAAALLAGDGRAVVYLEEEHEGGSRGFRGREIILGKRSGDYYTVVSGLQEGETVVTRGAFKLDAAMQIRGRPGMMRLLGDEVSTEPDADPHIHHHGHAAQEDCPVMGWPADDEIYADAGGYRIYVCCAGCDEEVMDDPERHIEKLKGAGIKIERIEGHTH